MSSPTDPNATRTSGRSRRPIRCRRVALADAGRPDNRQHRSPPRTSIEKRRAAPRPASRAVAEALVPRPRASTIELQATRDSAVSVGRLAPRHHPRRQPGRQHAGQRAWPDATITSATVRLGSTRKRHGIDTTKTPARERQGPGCGRGSRRPPMRDARATAPMVAPTAGRWPIPRNRNSRTEGRAREAFRGPGQHRQIDRGVSPPTTMATLHSRLRRRPPPASATDGQEDHHARSRRQGQQQRSVAAASKTEHLHIRSRSPVGDHRRLDARSAQAPGVVGVSQLEALSTTSSPPQQPLGGCSTGTTIDPAAGLALAREAADRAPISDQRPLTGSGPIGVRRVPGRDDDRARLPSADGRAAGRQHPVDFDTVDARQSGRPPRWPEAVPSPDS